MARRTTTVLAGAIAALVLAAPASAAPSAVFGGKVPCSSETRKADGVIECIGVGATPPTSFDGAPIDVNVWFPAEGDGPFPLVGMYHGWGGSKLGYSNTIKSYVQGGYAVFTMSDRGWGQSCGGQDQKRIGTACANGYNHLMDTRFEVRDAQYLISILADEGIAKPKKIGSMGGSYGGGISMAHAALRNRVMIDGPDGKPAYAPWKSPGGLDMEFAAATPEIPWTDLAYSLSPTGRTLDYVVDNPYGTRGGIMKQSFVSGLFALGLPLSNYAPPGFDEDADLFKWYALTSGGEPYDDNPQLQDTLDELTTHHSSYYIDDSVEPAPLLINDGFTDDLFPVDEAVRFYNRTRAEWPQAKVAMFHMDNGHQRGQNKAADKAALAAAQRAWMDHYLQGETDGEDLLQPWHVKVRAIECDGANASAEHAARSWADLTPGEVRFTDAAAKTIVSGGDPRVSQAFDPIAGSGACATTASNDQPGTATYRLPAAPEAYTIAGSPTVIADVAAPSPHAQVASRLLDVDPETGDQRLIARGLYRPDAAGRQVFQTHPTTWKVEKGHIVKLELLAHDAPYGRVSNGGGPVTVSNLELRVPTIEKPNGTFIEQPAPKVVPAGKTLVNDWSKSAKRKKATKKRRKSAAKRKRR